MTGKIFLAAPGNGIARAECGAGGQWRADSLLESLDVRCLASNPGNPSTIYAGSQGHGVFRSLDAGRTWQPCGMEGQIVKSLAVNPHNPNIIYAGTKPAYLFASRDGGNSWEELKGFRRIPNRWWWFSPAETPNQAYVNAIAVSPTEANVILAGIEFGAVVRSEDGGVTWSAHRKGALRDCHTLKFHTKNGNWAYQAGGTGGGASFSQNGGETWRKAKAGLEKHYGVACAADPAQPEIWYVSVAPSPAKAYGETAEAYLYRTRGGSDWEPIGWEAHPMRHMPMALVIDPKAPGHLYAGLRNGNVWHTVDYGDHWEKLDFSLKSIWLSLIVLSGS